MVCFFALPQLAALALHILAYGIAASVLTTADMVARKLGRADQSHDFFSV